MWKVAGLALTAATLMGCANEAELMAECEAKGVSRDTCYMAEQNRQNEIRRNSEENYRMDMERWDREHKKKP
ncbi:hypothetical protein GGE65_005214 [Skermanella aerolata]|uniref:Lipoprotein n=1 Tax=Skermanella aerolata TaxID=393310 RepID=A0A512DLM0_9PROT|nr:hypothetical protein [Skermanella aerolata]KJB96241.1 hypothetical protein N826_35080 [Skermanella aerolata KACC 11604]GEO37373.1 hypothetical protein SAE02_15210 [Skermanella aerolata]